VNRADNMQRAGNDSGSPWVWLPAGLLLALWAYVPLTDIFEFNFEPGLFLPVWAAFMTFRFGRRAAGPLLVAGFFVLVGATVNIDYIQMSAGIPVDIGLVAIFAAFAFCRSEATVSHSRPLVHSSRWTVLLAVTVLAVTAMAPPIVDTDVVRDLTVRLDVGAILAAVILAAGLRWPNVLSSLRDCTAGNGTLGRILMWCLVILCIGGLLLTIDFEAADWLTLHFGFSYAGSWLLALSFGLTATRAVSLRWLLTLLLIAYVVVVIGHQLIELLPSPPPAPPPPPAPRQSGEISLESIIVTGSPLVPSTVLGGYRAWAALINGATAAILGAVIAPFWNERRIAALAHGSVPFLLGAVLVLQFVGHPAGAERNWSFYPLALGGVAFVGGLVWGGRGAAAAPLIIQVCCLLSYAAFGSDLRGDIMSETARLGAISFPLAYFGMLARRATREATA
jgi:hypothetical protein